jgi:hypothetical protein
MIKDFLTYIKENQGSPVDGRYGFYMFLHTLDEMKFSFIKSGNYLNTGNFLYFFRTEWIKKPIDVLDGFEFKDSVKNTFRTYGKISNEKLSFYFGIRNGILEYGFYNDLKDVIYKTGQLNIKDNELRQIKSYSCLAMISGVLRIASTKTLTLLHEIKKDLKYFFEDKTSKGIIILTTMRLRKVISKELLKDNMKNSDDLTNTFVEWCNKYPWGKKIEAYIDDSEDDVSFYIKIKSKNSDKPVVL